MSAHRLWSAAVWIVAASLAVAWVVQVEYVHASIQVGNAVPAIPAIAVLAISGLAAWLARRRGRALDPRRAFAVFLVVAVAAAVPTQSSLVYAFGQITSAQVLADKPGMAAIAGMLPAWYAPRSGEHFARFMDGSLRGGVPWEVWAFPLAGWALFLVTLLATLYAMLALLRRPWMDHERLTYPMVQIPVSILGAPGRPAIWRAPWFWVGFALTASFDGLNMAHAFHPELPSIGNGWYISDWFTEPPWSAMKPFLASYRPEILGIGFLMPTDVLLTAWLSYVLLRLSSAMRMALGEEIASGPYDYQELGIGAFIALFVLLVARAWPHLRISLREALGRGEPRGRSAEPLSARTAWLLAVGGPCLMLAWLGAAGLPLWLGALHLTLLVATAIVYARLRAETGATSLFLFPFWQQQQLILNVFGTLPLSTGAGRALTVLASVGGLSRGVLPEICAYGAEGMALAGRTRMSQRVVTAAYLTGAVIGLALGGALYLMACYRYGATSLGGGYMMGRMQQQFTTVNQVLATPLPPRPDLMAQTAVGAAVAVLLNGMRQRLLWFPLHPMGFAMASSYGYHLWAPFFVAWCAKSLALRIGGRAAYETLLPAFIGIALGRYLFTGIVWGLLGLTGHPAVQSYIVHFS